MITRRRFIGYGAASALGSMLTALPVCAQAWPTRFVRVIVPFPAGSPPDVVSRLLAARLSAIWGQQVVIENKLGAGGNIGTEAVARSAPDGYTLLTAVFTHTVNPFLYRSIGYDPIADFAPVTLVSVQPCVMVVPNSSPAHSVAEFIAFAKANKGKITFASAGHGTSPHLSGELFKRMTGIEMMHVPYRSGAQQDLIAGRVDVLFAVGASGITMMRAGQVRGLAVTGSKRVATAPELPTVAEAGVPGFDVTPWSGLLLPAKTAPAIIDKIHDDTVAVLAEAGIKDRLQELGVTPLSSTPEEFSRYLKAEMEKWGPIIRDAKITIDD
jgi:tripartite-type tricarboxylate transporter receptor subunit TctC